MNLLQSETSQRKRKNKKDDFTDDKTTTTEKNKIVKSFNNQFQLTKKRRLNIDIADYKQFESFSCQSVGNLTLQIFQLDDLDNNLKDWIFELCKQNMQEIYKPVWGWKDGKKKKELFMRRGNYIVVFDEQKIPLAYCIFRFENEGNSVVQYVYELQLEKIVQRQGLGQKMMELVEEIGMDFQMGWIMLTTLSENLGAFKFYQKLGYEIDESDPQLCDETDVRGYRIMSKYLQQGEPVSKYE
eukprot:TRINITY_DN12453_c0_g1_i1.p1 TRINITY_DN12453_c0_g1~~TRINITY_DN12453_c0_g1_i1.p1  ORF type:complete len:241 (-),score=34.44 TRINITY_DN12453_c0_g1_i1:162-884(-)